MSFSNLVIASQKYFPNLKIKYKDQSTLMKICGRIMFFSPGFMTEYTTTIGETVYFPSASYTKLHPVTSYILLLHELVHIHDERKLSKPLFALSYLFPQILFPLAFLLFLVSWKIALPALLLLAAPLPAFWRMRHERRAYLTSMYSMSKLGRLLNFDPHLGTQSSHFVDRFKDSTYYFMWPFGNIDRDFSQAMTNILNNQTPFQDDVLFAIIDDLVSSCRSS